MTGLVTIEHRDVMAITGLRFRGYARGYIRRDAALAPDDPPLPLAPPCNRQRPFFVAGDRQGFPLFV
jgi:hypothetical protein